MNPKLLLPRVLVVLLGLTVVLLITTTVVLAVAAVLRGMGDQFGGLVLDYVALGTGILVVVAGICLLLGTAIYVLGNPQSPEETP